MQMQSQLPAPQIHHRHTPPQERIKSSPTVIACMCTSPHVFPHAHSCLLLLLLLLKQLHCSWLKVLLAGGVWQLLFTP